MSSIDEIIKIINKKYGKGTILAADKAAGLVVDRLPSGIFNFDLQIGGGFPRGRISMIKGDFSTGKSAICLKTVLEAQRHCRLCGKRFESVGLGGEVIESNCSCGKKEPMRVVWLDAEHSWDTLWAKKWGVDTSSVYVIETEYAEQAIDVADACIRSKECDLMVVDSIAALTPGIEISESAENWQMGVLARLINKALRKWTSGLNSYGLLGKTKCTILLINQLRMGLGGYHPTITSPGGRGLDFFQSLEVRFKKNSFIEDQRSKRPVGISVEFSVRKNKTAPMSSGGLFSLYFIPVPGLYGVGSTDLDAQVLQMASFWGLIKKSGGWYYFPDGSKLHGIEQASSALRENVDLMSDLIAQITDRELAWQTNGDLVIDCEADAEE